MFLVSEFSRLLISRVINNLNEWNEATLTNVDFDSHTSTQKEKRSAVLHEVTDFCFKTDDIR